jgi:hypothetical protein
MIGVVVVIVVIICVELLAVILSTLYLASVAFVAEGIVEVVAFKADPVLRTAIACVFFSGVVRRMPFAHLCHCSIYN